ncbi:MAG: glucose-1-phosphate cytidylyltransferase [Candidatus Omnitrophota bacterium]
MKAVILAGGYGTRLSEETDVIPKPMVQIGGKPILWHIMKYYASFGVHDFVICCGYKGYVIKEYFANYFLHTSDVTFHIASNRMKVHQKYAEDWRVTLVDTGENVMTGGRLRRIRQHLDEKPFLMTYGDGLSNVDLKSLLGFHKKKKPLVTVTAVQPPVRFGALSIRSGRVQKFQEKTAGDGGWVNGGFFVIEPKALNYARDDRTVWERDVMELLAKDGELAAYQHSEFWQPMDTLRDKQHLEELWRSGKAPWKVWK